MGQSMRDNSIMAKWKDTGLRHGQMGIDMKGSSKIISSTGKGIFTMRKQVLTLRKNGEMGRGGLGTLPDLNWMGGSWKDPHKIYN